MHIISMAFHIIVLFVPSSVGFFTALFLFLYPMLLMLKVCRIESGLRISSAYGGIKILNEILVGGI